MKGWLRYNWLYLLFYHFESLWGRTPGSAWEMRSAQVTSNIHVQKHLENTPDYLIDN